jgi:hypothetical protein
MTPQSTIVQARSSAEDVGCFYGNENRRSQSQGSTGSSCLQILHSPARTIPTSSGVGPGTRLRDSCGAALMGFGLVAGATTSGHAPSERLPCRLQSVRLIVRQSVLAPNASLAVAGIDRDGAAEGLDAATRGLCAQPQSATAGSDESATPPCGRGSSASTPGNRPSGAAQRRSTGPARNNRRIPPEILTPSLLATVFTSRISGNRHLAYYPVTPSSLKSAPILGGSGLALLH